MVANTKLRIVLCGSSSFGKEIVQCAEQLGRLDVDVVSPSNINSEGKQTTQSKVGTFFNYFEEIKKSDAVLVVNCTKGSFDGYVGPHTLIEMAYAVALKRPIFLLNSRPTGLAWCDETNALNATELNGDLGTISKHLASRPKAPAAVEPDAIAPNNDKEHSHEFKLERLRFILQQIDGLNKANANQWKLFQAVVSALVGATAIVVGTWKSHHVGADVAVFAVYVLIWLLVAHGFFTVATLISNVLSWFDLRSEEIKVFNDAVTTGYRDQPDWRNWNRWSETWMIVFAAVATIGLGMLGWFCAVPTIK